MNENKETHPLDEWTFIRLYVPDAKAALTMAEILLSQGYNVVIGAMNRDTRGVSIEISKNF